MKLTRCLLFQTFTVVWFFTTVSSLSVQFECPLTDAEREEEGVCTPGEKRVDNKSGCQICCCSAQTTLISPKTIWQCKKCPDNTTVESTTANVENVTSPENGTAIETTTGSETLTVNVTVASEEGGSTTVSGEAVTTDGSTTVEANNNESTTIEGKTDVPLTTTPQESETATTSPEGSETKTSESPAIDSQTTEPPTTESPANDAPASEEPAADETATEETATSEPVPEESPAEEPNPEEQATEEPNPEEQVTEANADEVETPKTSGEGEGNPSGGEASGRGEQFDALKKEQITTEEPYDEEPATEKDWSSDRTKEIPEHRKQNDFSFSEAPGSDFEKWLSGVAPHEGGERDESELGGLGGKKPVGDYDYDGFEPQDDPTRYAPPGSQQPVSGLLTKCDEQKKCRKYLIILQKKTKKTRIFRI